MSGLGIIRKDVKNKNRGRLLKLIATKRCSSRTDLAKAMGLTKMAISNIVFELEDKGLIIEAKGKSDKEIKSGVGRPPVNLRISYQAPKTAGVLISRDKCEAVLCDFYLNILMRESVELQDETKDSIIEKIYKLLGTVIKEENNLTGIGIASIGPINSEAGMILNPGYFFGIENIPIVSLMEEKFGIPVFLDHDNQSGALAELLYGNGKDIENFMLLGISRGVGCGIIKNGELYSDTNRLAPEIGHVSIDYRGKKCICGNRGCLEIYINTEEMERRLREVSGESMNFGQFCEAVNKEKFEKYKCEHIKRVFDDFTEKTAAGLVSTMNLFNPDMILLGYSGCLLPEYYVKLLEKIINKKRFNKNGIIPVRKTLFGEDSQLLGAACNVMNRIFEGELLFD